MTPSCTSSRTPSNSSITVRENDALNEVRKIVVKREDGKASVDHVRDLRGVLDREKAAIGILISLQPPTKEMEKEAASTGFYIHKLNQQQYPKLQLRTVKQLMEGKGIERPASAASVDETFKKAPKAKANDDDQDQLIF